MFEMRCIYLYSGLLGVIAAVESDGVSNLV